MTDNFGCELDLGWINSVAVNAWSAYDAEEDLTKEYLKLNGIYKAAWLLKAVSCIDLTTLSGDDTYANVAKLAYKAGNPISHKILEKFSFPIKPFTTSAVCVYPARIQDAAEAINNISLSDELPIAAVASGFPSGQYHLSSKLLEIRNCVENGAKEIDVVVDRSLILTNKWEQLYEELQQMKEACGDAKMKTILAVGELAHFRNVFKASLVSMMAGSDFIKTSTGKETVNATLPVGLVIVRAIQDYYIKTSYKVGFKAAGGIKSTNDALNWLALVKRELGVQWLNKSLFRIGASGLLQNIERELFVLAFDRNPSFSEFILG